MTPATVRFSFLFFFFLFRVRCASLRARFRRSACRARRYLLYYIIIIIIFTIIIDVVLCGARVNAGASHTNRWRRRRPRGQRHKARRKQNGKKMYTARE